MSSYKLAEDEVILMSCDVSRGNSEKELQLTLTSKKMIFESTTTKGFFKAQTETKIVDKIMLESIKMHNGKVQVQQKGSNVFIQTIEKNFSLSFDNRIEAMKFVTKVVDIITGTTISDRGVDKLNGAINKVDSVLGFDTRNTVKGVLENGITGTILKGIKKDKKNK